MEELTVINILIKEDNLMVIQPKLAKLLGISETIILNQIHYWLEKKKNIIEGRSWVYNTYENWQEQICFLSVSTIKKAIKKMESIGIIIASNFNRSKVDKTKWYTIDYEVLGKLYEAENDKERDEEISEDKISSTVEENNKGSDINDQCTDINSQSTDINEQSKGEDISEEGVGSRIIEMCKDYMVEIEGKENNYRVNG
jgi:biotin operon repressor